MRGIVAYRVLGVSDEPLLQEFLRGYRDSSMFLRSNLSRAGIVYGGVPFSALYMGDFDGERLCGVVAHSWSGMLLIQAL